MYGAANRSDYAEPANRYNACSSHSWFGERCGKLSKAKSVPPEDAAGTVDNTPCELIGCVKGCPDNNQLLRGFASLEPSPGTSNAAVVH